MRGGPEFLIIGAARSGTTALASFLGQHPDVFVSAPKEPHFLAFPDGGPHFTGLGDDDLVNGPAVREQDVWLGLFHGRPELRRGEGSVTTLAYPEVSIPRVQRWCAPDCRLVAVLRDPVDRAYSSWLYLRSRGYDAGSFLECLDAEEQRTAAGWSHMWQLRRLSRYAEQLEPYMTSFGDRLLVLVQEEFLADPAGQLRLVLEHLGVDPDVPIDATRKVNEGGTPRSPRFAAALNLLRRTPAARRLVLSAVPERRREQVRSAVVTRPALDDAVRRELSSSLVQDTRRLQELLGRDLQVWPTAGVGG